MIDPPRDDIAVALDIRLLWDDRAEAVKRLMREAWLRGWDDAMKESKVVAEDAIRQCLADGTLMPGPNAR